MPELLDALVKEGRLMRIDDAYQPESLPVHVLAKRRAGWARCVQAMPRT
ncbi:MAG TPA: hypothetical protein VEH79_05055 [Gaiellaceae bacterium]|nr:hypothetical protein [Gaiellaceae bacterium]